MATTALAAASSKAQNIDNALKNQNLHYTKRERNPCVLFFATIYDTLLKIDYFIELNLVFNPFIIHLHFPW